MLPLPLHFTLRVNARALAFRRAAPLLTPGVASSCAHLVFSGAAAIRRVPFRAAQRMPRRLSLPRIRGGRRYRRMAKKSRKRQAAAIVMAASGSVTAAAAVGIMAA